MFDLSLAELLQIKKEFKGKERGLIEEKTAYFEEKKELTAKLNDLDLQYRKVEKNVETRFLREQEALISGLRDTITKFQSENKQLKVRIIRLGLAELIAIEHC